MTDYQGSEQHKLNISIARLKSGDRIAELKQSRITLYLTNPSRCKRCNIILEYTRKRYTFCSTSCSATHNNTQRAPRSEESRRKTSVAMKNLFPTLEQACAICSAVYTPRNIKSRFCTPKCRTQWWRSDEGREHSRNTQLKCIEDGTHKGWATRSKLKPSYPEQYFIDLFHKEHIEVQREIKFGKYFADFFIESIKLVIEIDGKQHTYPDYVTRDHQKDEYLSSIGLRVLRITWYNPRTNRGKELLYPQIEIMKQIIRM